MILKHFEIKAYRSCVNTKLDLQSDLTALIGINGAGKSNLLNAILLLKKILTRSRIITSKRRETLYSRCEIQFSFEIDKKIIYGKGSIFYETDEKNLDDVQFTKLRWNFKDFLGESKWYEVPIEFFSLNFHRHSQLQLEFNSKQINDYFRFFSFEDSFPKKAFPLLEKITEFIFGINYYSASQFSDPSKCPISIELDENRPLKRIRTNLSHENFILDLFKSWESNSKGYKKYFNTIGLSGLGLVEGIDFKKIDMPSNTYEIKTGGKIRQIERIRSVVVPNFQIDGNNLSPNQLSEGTLKTLALLFYTLTDDSHLLLIEEPEVCIHHGLLNSIVSIIKSQAKSKQIVISTHSDYVLDLLKPENIILVKKDKKKGTIAALLTKTLSSNDFKALRSYLLESGNLGEYWKEGGFGNE